MNQWLSFTSTRVAPAARAPSTAAFASAVIRRRNRPYSAANAGVVGSVWDSWTTPAIPSMSTEMQTRTVSKLSLAVTLYYKVLDNRAATPHRVCHGRPSAPARPRARQPPLHPADDGARRIVYRGAGLGPGGGRRHRARRGVPRGASADPRGVARDLAGRSDRGARHRLPHPRPDCLSRQRSHPVRAGATVRPELPAAHARGRPAHRRAVPRRPVARAS